MNTSIPHRIGSASLLFALALTLCAAPARADYQVQYFVGYGLYYPFATNTASTTPGEGLLARNSTHRTLIQLIWAGPDGIIAHPEFSISLGEYVYGDDVVLESRIIEAGINGVDEWGYTSSLPPPYASTNSTQKPVFVRVHQDETPTMSSWYYDSPLVWPEDVESHPVSSCFATILPIETGSETVPTSGVCLNQTLILDPIENWFPDLPLEPVIHDVEFTPESADITFTIPFSYSLHAVYGADSILPSGDWNWQPLTEGTDYTLTNDLLTLLTTGTSVAPRHMVRIGLIHNF